MTKLENWIQRAKAFHGERYDYSKSQYVNSKTKICITCIEHGDFWQQPDNHAKGCGCPECAKVIIGSARRGDLETFLTHAKEVHGDVYEYSKAVYTGTHSKLIVTCKVHGDFFVSPTHHITSKSGCPKCVADKNRLPANEFFEECNNIHNYKYDYSKSVFVNVKSEIEIICPVHGTFWQMAKNHKNGSGCAKCSFEESRSNTEEFIEKASVVHSEKYSYDFVEYELSKKKVPVTCKKHGEFLVTPSNHLLGHGCPNCVVTPIISSHEHILRELYPEVEFSNRKLIGRELDLLFQDNKLAVEINGRFWHSEYNGKDSAYHLHKTEKCLENGIQLLHFWDSEILGKLDIVKSMIDSRIGKSNRVFARNTNVVKLSETDSKNFLEANHLQGYITASVAYGLVHEGKLISVMSFAKPRFNKKYDYEILRYATELGLTVVGGASKLFKQFLKEFNPNSVITYADRRYSEGGVYEKIGFKFVSNSKPNYFYTKGAKDLSRYACQKHKLQKLLGDGFDESRSEHENMFANGWYRVYDCGSKVFVWEK